MQSILIRFAPILFVLIWSTGWIVGGYAAPHADPLAFLSIRFGLAALVMAFLSFAAGSVWPRGMAAIHAILSGILLHGIYLGAIWWVIAEGLPVGISGLIAAIQPLSTSLLARPLTGERLSLWQWGGILLGLVGLIMALWPKMANVDLAQAATYRFLIVVNIIGMIAVTLGTIYQKRYLQSGGLRPISTLQYVGAALFTLPVALMIEPFRVDWNIHFVIAMAWSVLGLSVGAIMLLLMLIRQGAVSRAASLIYLVPPMVAVEAWILYGETMQPIQIAGTIIIVFGVYLVSQRER